MEIQKPLRIMKISAWIMVALFGYAVLAATNNAVNSNVFSDSDQDGLSDEEERTYGTDPHNPDTDNDGYGDGTEVESGYDPLKSAPGDKLIAKSQAAQPEDSSNLTDMFMEDIRGLINEKGEETVSVSDLDAISSSIIDENGGEEITMDNLPPFDINSLNIKIQDYSSLEKEEQKAAYKKDTELYLLEVVKIFAMNSPQPIRNSEDFRLVFEDILNHLNDLNAATPDYTYFRIVGNKLSIIVDELKVLEVPETMAAMHTDAIRLLSAYLETGKQAPRNSQDYLARVVHLNKINRLITLSKSYVVVSYDHLSKYISGNY